MKALTFKGGIHPDDQKALTKDKPVEVILPQKGTKMVFPMIQHIGVECTPLVKPGDYVLLGQKIGDTDSLMSAPIHTSISGTVKEIVTRYSPSGLKVNSVIIENDALLQEHESIVPDEDYENLTKEQILDKIRQAGIVGMGGAGFPTHVKLNVTTDKKIDYILVNASECEPYLTTDYRVLLEESERIKIGLQIVLKIFPTATGIIAIETNKMDAIEKMIEACADDKRIKVVALKTKYPQGSEKQLIYACTKRMVPSGKLPADVGVIVNNVDTIIAIHRAIVRGRPLMRRIITTTGGAVKNPGNYKARLGMSYRELFEQTGGFTEEPYQIISGGPMMGVELFDLDVPIIKTSSAVICLTKREVRVSKERNCIRCSKCVQYCPSGLMPLELNQLALRDDFEAFERMHGMDCVECGVCSYVCPSKRYLSLSIRAARRNIMALRRSNKK